MDTKAILNKLLLMYEMAPRHSTEEWLIGLEIDEYWMQEEWEGR